MEKIKDIQRRVRVQNDKYQVIEEKWKDKNSLIKRTFRSGNGQFATIVSETFFLLKERYWFFGWHWRIIGFTNSSSIAMEWVKEYFKGERT